MKNIFFTAIVLLTTLASCANRETVSQETQDSLAAAAADSMLNDALAEDTTTVDKVKVDSTGTDSL